MHYRDIFDPHRRDRDHDEARRRRGPSGYEDRLRDSDGPGRLEDYGQADYSTDYVYDEDRHIGRRADRPDYVRRSEPDDRPRPAAWPGEPHAPHPADTDRRREAARSRAYAEDRSWRDDDGREPVRETRRRRPAESDRVIYAAVTERLAHSRIDTREMDVDVREGEVTLDGWVRRRSEKRHAEDLCDIRGVIHIQNNLRVHEMADEKPAWRRLLDW